jgi:hypothetical protein
VRNFRKYGRAVARRKKLAEILQGLGGGDVAPDLRGAIGYTPSESA